MRVRTMALTMVGATMAASAAFTGVAFAATNPVVSGSGCHLAVWDPGSQVNVWSSQQRSGCSNSATLTAQLKRDISFSPDPVDAQVVGSGVSISLLPYEPCAAHGSAVYYGSAHSSAGTNLDGTHLHRC